MIQPPKVSVIVLNYNYATFLEKRISSILNQTFQDFEIIILDDCSTDSSRDIIEKYRHNPKVKQIFYNDYNIGSPFKQWEKGISYAQGVYIWLAESDDWSEHNFLETLIEGIESNDNCVVAYAQTYMIRQNDITYQSKHSKLTEIIEGKTFINNYMVKYPSILNASMAIFKKEAYLSISKSFLDFRYCGDWVFWMELAHLGNVFISGKCLNYFRRHSESIIAKGVKDGSIYFEKIAVAKLLYQKYKINKSRYFDTVFLHYNEYREQREKYEAADIKQLNHFFYSETIGIKAYHLKIKYNKIILLKKIKLILKKIIRRN
jgi:glycosyltransferase involved in cell wall biosynthesis